MKINNNEPMLRIKEKKSKSNKRENRKKERAVGSLEFINNVKVLN